MTSAPLLGIGGLDPEDANAIRQVARGSLIAAGALELTPAPIDEIISAVGLQQQNLFDLGEDVPPSILAIAKKLSGKLLGAAAKRDRIIYVDSSVKYERGRFTKAHELGHTALSWHEQAYFADDQHTLDRRTRATLEREANLFAAEILFGIDRFTEQIDSLRFSPQLVEHFASEHHASLHAGLHRFAETSRRPAALLVLGRIPVYPNGLPSLKILSSTCSRSFTERYGHIGTLLPAALPIATGTVVGAARSLEHGNDPQQYDFKLDTKRGSTVFDGYAFAGRVKFVLLHRRPIMPQRKPIILGSRTA